MLNANPAHGKIRPIHMEFRVEYVQEGGMEQHRFRVLVCVLEHAQLGIIVRRVRRLRLQIFVQRVHIPWKVLLLVYFVRLGLLVEPPEWHSNRAPGRARLDFSVHSEQVFHPLVRKEHTMKQADWTRSQSAYCVL